MIFKFTDNFIFFKKKIHQSFAEFKNCTTFASAIKQYGRLAQLVQSIWFTPRGSGVRIPQRPHSISMVSGLASYCKAIFLSVNFLT